MRTTTRNTVYLSDYFTVPKPSSAASHEDYLRKLRNRRILWALLPYLVEAFAMLVLLLLLSAGICVFAVSMGG